MSSSAQARPLETLAERFWSLARAAEKDGIFTGAHDRDPVTVARRVLVILDALETDAKGADLTQRTVSFLMLLRQHEAEGDLSYASPEQARGDRVDERSLVFSVGVLIFEQLTGRHPFGATNGPVRLARMQRGELGSGVQFFPQVPPALRAVLVRSMGPFPEERYGSLAELRDELERFAGIAAKAAALAAVPPPEIAASTNRADLTEKVVSIVPLLREEAPRRGTRRVRVRPRWVDRLLFSGIGAVVATAAILAPQLATKPTPAAPLPAPRPPLVEARPSKAAVPVQIAKPALVLPKVTQLAPVAFDAQHVAEAAATALNGCFEARPLAAFGVGVLFNKGDTHARRVFMSKSEPLSFVERRCVVGRLKDFDAGAAPASSYVLELRLRLRHGVSNDVRVSLTPP